MAVRAYRLILEGELSEVVTQAFAGTIVRLEEGNTILLARDQAELMALLRRVSALGLTLITATTADEPKPPTGRSRSHG